MIFHGKFLEAKQLLKTSMFNFCLTWLLAIGSKCLSGASSLCTLLGSHRLGLPTDPYFGRHGVWTLDASGKVHKSSIRFYPELIVMIRS